MLFQQGLHIGIDVLGDFRAACAFLHGARTEDHGAVDDRLDLVLLGQRHLRVDGDAHD